MSTRSKCQLVNRKRRKWGEQWDAEAMNYLLESGPNFYFKSKLASVVRGKCLVLGVGSEVKLVDEFSGYVVGINISREDLLSIKKSGANLVLGDAQKLPFKDSCFDSVVCKSTLHHLNRHNEGLSEVWRILHKGGGIIFYEPGALNPIAMVGRKFFPTDIHVSSERPFVPTALKEMLSKSLFDIVDEGYFLLFTHIFPILGRWIPLFRSIRLLKAVYHLDVLLCKSGLKQFCWIMIYAVRKGY